MSSSQRKPWTRDELILAINLYCKTTFGQIHIRNPEIILLAEKLGRTPGSISYKLANFASLDPTLDRKGASNVSQLDKAVWDEFFNDWDKMYEESEKKMAQLLRPNSGLSDCLQVDFQHGKMVDRTISVRKNQGIFRKMVLSSYNGECCITGIKNKDLLIASHIVPWAKDVKNRLNPMNGLCLNPLHDKAFDKGLITLNENYEVTVSNKEPHELLHRYANQPISLPSRFRPGQDFLEYHRSRIFQG